MNIYYVQISNRLIKSISTDPAFNNKELSIFRFKRCYSGDNDYTLLAVSLLDKIVYLAYPMKYSTIYKTKRGNDYYPCSIVITNNNHIPNNFIVE